MEVDLNMPHDLINQTQGLLRKFSNVLLSLIPFRITEKLNDLSGDVLFESIPIFVHFVDFKRILAIWPYLPYHDAPPNLPHRFMFDAHA